ncbi:MAG: hypothetical protein NTZ11_05580 [Gammaproteobacteria bacterium]|jgi:hypothetical protein|nr:hypothetical protein [Gammaproteobacteria bacterium]
MAIPNNRICINHELASVVRSTAESTNRTLSQQITHWAQIGRELERSRCLTMSLIQAVLDGQGDYDALDSYAQAIVRVNWAERIDKARKTLRLLLPTES